VAGAHRRRGLRLGAAARCPDARRGRALGVRPNTSEARPTRLTGITTAAGSHARSAPAWSANRCQGSADTEPRGRAACDVTAHRLAELRARGLVAAFARPSGRAVDREARPPDQLPVATTSSRSRRVVRTGVPDEHLGLPLAAMTRGLRRKRGPRAPLGIGRCHPRPGVRRRAALRSGEPAVGTRAKRNHPRSAGRSSRAASERLSRRGFVLQFHR